MQKASANPGVALQLMPYLTALRLNGTWVT